MRRETQSLRPPISQNIRCLAVIMGETGDSERNYGIDRLAKNAIHTNESRGDLEMTSQIAKQGSFWANLDQYSTTH